MGTNGKKTSVKKGSSKKSSSKKSSAKKKRNKIILFVAEFFILAILGCILFFVIKFGEANGGRVVLDESKLGVNNDTSVFEPEQGDLPEARRGYKQVALFGVDSTEGELDKNTRTDTIIIAVIDLDTKDIKLCSVYRDTFLNLGNDSYSKCNAAYAKGSAEQAIRMLNMNLDLNITDYITVGFKGVVETVDALGGVDIAVTKAEIEHLNNYQLCISENLNRKGDYHPVTTDGMQTLNGLQACGYCRIRYTDNDFKRTERQRNVLKEMANRCKTTSPSKLTDVATKAVENTRTSFDLNEILEFAVESPNFNIVGSEGFPFEEYRKVGTIGNAGSCVIPTDLATNVTLLHEYLFGEENYEPSSTVKECSDTIKAKTSPYL